MDRRLILCFGPVCSGKTTWAKEFQRLNKGFLRFSFDEYLYMTTGEGKYNENVALCCPAAVSSMLVRSSVIIDSFPLNMSSFRTVMNSRLTYSAIAEIHIFEVRLDEAIKRNGIRAKQTGRFVSLEEMRNYRRSHEDFINDPEFQENANSKGVVLHYHLQKKIEPVF